MAVETLSGVPCHFESGNTVIFEEDFPDFPATSWASTFCLSLNGTALAPVTATTDGATFIYTLADDVTAAFAAGTYDYAIYVTLSGERTTAKRGRVKVQPNLATSQTPTFAQAQVTLLQTALANLNTSDKQSVSFNGQSFTRAAIGQYREQLVYWQARVRHEQEQGRIEDKDSTIGPHF
jgi:hypothetical protein